MDEPSQPPPLRLIHPRSSLREYKLVYFRTRPTDEIIRTLEEGKEPLYVKADGTVMNGHHRLVVLLERRVDIDRLPRTPHVSEGFGDE